MRPPLGVVAETGTIAAQLGAIAWRFRRMHAEGGRLHAEGGRLHAEGGRLLPDGGELEPAVYALWHEHLLPLAVCYRNSGAVVLVSRSRDGELLARVLERLGYRTVRASSSDGGATGLRALAAATRGGRAVAIAPDGPRGPRRRCKGGVVQVAAETKLPIVPVGAATTRGWRLTSWDRFLLPAPGALVLLCHGPAIRIPARVGRAELGAWTERVAAALNEATRACEHAARRAAAGHAPPPGVEPDG